ncbi:MAG: hypothetical protein AB8G23_05675 [Myxococcota bacterium]
MNDSQIFEGAPSRRGQTLALVGIAILSLVYRFVLIDHYPTVFSWDAFTRLWDPSRLIVRHWLPIPQLPIFVGDRAGADLESVRQVYAVVGALGGALLGATAVSLLGFWRGIVSTVLCAVLPFYIVYTTVPYQEGFLALGLFGFLLAVARGASASDTGLSVPWELFASASLAMACASRYEAWVFAGIFALRPLAQREYRSLLKFVPSGFVVMAWLLFLLTSDSSGSPPPVPRDDPSTPVDLVFDSFGNWVAGLHFIGFGLALLGGGLALRRRDFLGRELIAFTTFLFALGIYRAVNVGLATDRMMLVVMIMSVLYMPIGLFFLASRLPKGAQKGAVAALVAVSVVWSVKTAVDQFEERTYRFRKERAVAYLVSEIIAKSETESAFGVVPRPIKNVLGESGVRAIFAQSMDLHPTEERWILGKEQMERRGGEVQHVVYYDKEARKYQLLVAQAPK